LRRFQAPHVIILGSMRILLTGASGFAGAALLPALLQSGHELRALVRDRERYQSTIRALGVEPSDEVEPVVGDALLGEGLQQAMQGVEVAYYLIHSMEPAAVDAYPSTEPAVVEAYPDRERRAAQNFVAAAREAGVRRIVYLGGLLPSGRRPSRHLASRCEVERIIMHGVPDSVAIRASIVIGARSRSFRFLVRLIERLPVLVLPPWRANRTQPIDERDVVEMLARAATFEAVGGSTVDVGGPDVLSYEEIVRRIAELMLVGRPTIGIGVAATPIAAHLAAALTGEQSELFLPLMEGLDTDLLPKDSRARGLLEVPLHSFDSAVEHALRDWERREPLAAR
jgi:uncharacterized protein YbjT (DUF2867 family)